MSNSTHLKSSYYFPCSTNSIIKNKSFKRFTKTLPNIKISPKFMTSKFIPIAVDDEISHIQHISIPENRKTSLQIDNLKLTRKSPESTCYPMPEYIITSPKNIKAHDDAKNDTTQKVKLLELLTDIKFIAERYENNNELITPNKTDIAKVLQSLSLLANIDSPFSSHMKFVIKLLNMAIYFNTKLYKPYEEYFRNSDNPNLRLLVDYDNESKIPYYVVNNHLLNDLLHTNEMAINLEIQNKTKIIELQDIITNQTNQINELNEKLQFVSCKDEDDKTIYIDELDQLKLKNSRLIEENHLIKEMIDDLQNKNTILNELIVTNNKKLHDKIVIIDKIYNEKLKIVNELDQMKAKYEKLKGNSHNMKHMLDQLIIKLSNLKSDILVLKRENEDLFTQNKNLMIRAAIGFEQLTPRPDYDQLLHEKNIDLVLDNDLLNKEKMSNSQKSTKDPKISTIQFFELLLTKYTEANNKINLLEKSNKPLLSSTKPKDQSLNAKGILRSSTDTFKNKSMKSFNENSLLAQSEKNPLRSSKSYATQITREMVPSKIDMDYSLNVSHIDHSEQGEYGFPKTRLDISTPREKLNYDNKILAKADSLMAELIDVKRVMEEDQKNEELD